MQIIEYSDEWRNKWNEYVLNSPSATFFHKIEWSNVLSETYGYQTVYLMAVDDEKVLGILPLVLFRNLSLKKVLVSLPFAAYAGIDSFNAEACTLLREKAIFMAKKSKCEFLELRNLHVMQCDFQEKDLYYTFIKELPHSPDLCLNEIPRKSRASIRKAIEGGLTTDVGLRYLEEFYRIYTISVRNLGSPVFSFKFLESLVSNFKNYINVLMVKYESKNVAGVLTFFHKGTVLPFYAGSLPQFLKYQVNNFMYFKLMEYGVVNKYKYFDFGRSKQGTGAFRFKEFMGFEPQQLHYYYYLNKAKSIPNISPLNPKFKLLINIWKHLPVTLTNIIGPNLIKLTPP